MLSPATSSASSTLDTPGIRSAAHMFRDLHRVAGGADLGSGHSPPDTRLDRVRANHFPSANNVALSSSLPPRDSYRGHAVTDNRRHCAPESCDGHSSRDLQHCSAAAIFAAPHRKAQTTRHPARRSSGGQRIGELHIACAPGSSPGQLAPDIQYLRAGGLS